MMTNHRPRSTTTRRVALAGLLGVLLMSATVGTAAAAGPTTAAAAAAGATLADVDTQALASGQLTLQSVVGGFASPLGVVNAGDGTGRLFVVQRNGLVRIVTGRSVGANFIDARSRVQAGGERGLLGVAFHPDFQTNREVYLYYTRASDGDIIISRLTANTARTFASLSTEEILLRIEHSTYSNHNGGSMAFGPDGFLYLGTGDGGGSGDPGRNAQSKTKNLLGKILRIDVGKSGSGPYGRYGIPSTNPFRGATSGLDEVWAYGLRNPWRISFDRATGMLYIADVGQSRYEEINREPANYKGGRNYGWNVMEGKHCYNASSCNTSGKWKPVAEYTHSHGNCSITGGYVYRGSTYPALVGQYVLADFCSGRFYTMPAAGSSLWMRRDTTLMVTSFGESESGELYAVTINGRLYQIGTK